MEYEKVEKRKLELEMDIENLTVLTNTEPGDMDYDEELVASYKEQLLKAEKEYRALRKVNPGGTGYLFE